MISDQVIDFDSLEKKVPFEILDICPYNENLFLVSGFSDQIGLISSDGHFLGILKTFS